ncbi:MAG TPA: ABC transporter permease [Burkholderiaceae bacterium]|nr:ABC transporter permease [Burkholderiaceae bacterium]
MPEDPAPASHNPSAQLRSAEGRDVLVLGGSWRLGTLPEIERMLAALALPAGVAVDGSRITDIDSAAALALLNRIATTGTDVEQLALKGFAPNEARIVEQVRRRLPEINGKVPHRREGLFAHIGRETLSVMALLAGHLNFLGEVLAGLARTLVVRGRLRPRELTAQFEQVCLNAIPVVALVTLLIGVVVAYLLGLQAEKYGANIFVVDGVGIGATREFAPIIVAVIVAGRSGAAFTAQLGSMRLNEETDAIRTLGLSPMDVLVLPRVLSLMLAMPLLVFVGDVMSLLGAMLIAGPQLDITPTTFLARLQENLSIRHVYVGLLKAPVFALFIAVIGCRMGMTVRRDTRALGIATTSTVVQGIVAVILLDAAFAVLFQELDI